MRVRNEHWEVLLTCCEENPELVTNRFSGFEGRAKGVALWQNIATKLNSMGFGEKSVDGWRKTLTDWKSKTKSKASALKREQQQTGGGPPQLPPLSQFEERLLLIMGTKALEGDEAVPEMGFGKVEIQKKSLLKNNTTIPATSPMIEVAENAEPYVHYLAHDLAENAEPYVHYSAHDYAKKVEVPSTSHGTGCSEEIGPSRSKCLKRRREQQGSKESRPFRRRPNATVGISNELLNLNERSVDILQGIDQNTKSISSSLEKISNNTESIANSLKEIANVLKNEFSNT